MDYKPLQIMKFGGTSVADAECIARAASNLSKASEKARVIAVVSALQGVTDRLIETAKLSETGNQNAADEMARILYTQHESAIMRLIPDAAVRTQLLSETTRIIGHAGSLCRGTALLRELTPRSLDAISGIGEKLSARILAATLSLMGVESIAIDATEIIVTNDTHGRAEPLLEPTQQQARAGLEPLLKEGILPVVTGFIAATAQGVPTTLGRGGSDYTATILGGALSADEVIIWTDVDGVLTADPRLVPDARIIAKISYAEAAELAHFGAKVLHPKTLCPVINAQIPVWIRNSYAPHQVGTQISVRANGPQVGVKAITAIKGVDLITVGGPAIMAVPDLVAQTFAAVARAQINVLLISQSSSQNDLCFVVHSEDTRRTTNALNEVFSTKGDDGVDYVRVDSSLAIVAIVGERMRGMPGIAGRAFSALGRERINIIAIAQGASEYSISFVIKLTEMQRAVCTIHSEFDLARGNRIAEDKESGL
ncbi:MAG TPA: aspartate kinase [Pyrinomonadaceae bacterium]|nr:aspartate kinase [Pyrinomonadaceae bacterium]